MSEIIYLALTKKQNLTKIGYSQFILNKYAEKFDKVNIFCLGELGESNQSNKHYLEGNILTWFKQFWCLEKSNVKFIVVSDWFIGGFIGSIFSKILNKPLLFRCGGMWLYTINSPDKLIKTLILKLTKPIVLRCCSNIVYNSKSIVQKKFKYKSHVVYNGVNTKIFKPVKSRHHKKLKVIFIGRLCAEKGLDYLLEAAEQIKDTIQLTIIGGGESKKYYKRKYTFAKFNGVVDHKKLPKIINDQDIIILPSLKNSTESFPSTILEAMACGKPVIGTNIYGIPEIIKNNYNGLLIPEKNAEAIKTAILKLQDKKLRNKLGKNGRKTVLKKFKLEPQIDKLYGKLFKKNTTKGDDTYVNNT
jgi:glycosyltransferase involved in cell wall biosynthesis